MEVDLIGGYIWLILILLVGAFLAFFGQVEKKHK